jgi:hypothetical protein
LCGKFEEVQYRFSCGFYCENYNGFVETIICLNAKNKSNGFLEIVLEVIIIIGDARILYE